jgi:hypothetical protein
MSDIERLYGLRILLNMKKNIAEKIHAYMNTSDENSCYSA